MRNIKPIYVMSEDGIEDFQLKAVLAGIREILQLAGVDQAIEVHNLGRSSEERSSTDDTLVPHKSVEWYVNRGREESSRPKQANASVVLDKLLELPNGSDLLLGSDHPHYHVLVLHTDIYQDEDTCYVAGSAYPALGTVLSVKRFCGLNSKEQMAGCIQTEVMHEVGHVFRVPALNRKDNVEESLGKHCTNNGCVMRQGLIVPGDWLRMTDERLHADSPLCAACLRDLRSFFSEQS